MEALEEWMHQDGRTNPELAYWVPKYVLLRGQRAMRSLGPMSVSMHQAAASQDMIGWHEFMEGKVSKRIANIQTRHCAEAPCMMNGDD